MKMRYIFISILVTLFIIIFFASKSPQCGYGVFYIFQVTNQKISSDLQALNFLKDRLNESKVIQVSTILDVEYKEISGKDIYGWVVKNEIAIDKDGNIYIRGKCL